MLVDRIDQQEKILNETKGIVTQQSTAIESQSKVVDTAIKYSEAFSPDKLEKLIRKEVEVEQREERGKLEAELNSRIKKKDEKIEAMGKTALERLELAQGLATDLLSPVMETLVKLILVMPKDEREEVISEMKDGASKDMLLSVLEQLEDKAREMISNKQSKADA